MPEIRLPIRPDGFESVMRTARRRRRRQLSAGGGLGASVIALVLLVPHAGGLDSLRPVENPVSGVIATDSASPTPTTSPGPQDSATPSPTPTDAANPGIPGSGSPADVASPTPEETLEPVLQVRSYPVVRDEIGYDGTTTSCVSNDTYDTGQGWCVQFPGPFTAKSGSTQDYRIQLCRLPGFPAATLSFSGDEASFDLTNNSHTEWVADRHPDDRTAATAVVQPSRCERWSVSWDTLDVNGELLPPSEGYSLDAAIYTDATIVGSRPSTNAVISLSNAFTITR